MSVKPTTAAGDPSDEIAAWVLKLQEAQERLQELTGGGIDSVLTQGGHSYMLQEAQEKLRESETKQRHLAGTLMTILDTLPAHIALLDKQGVIVSVNNTWQQFATSNMLQGPMFGVDENYLEICERVLGDCAEDAHAAGRGIRQVLSGETRKFELEYPCHSPTEKHWFQLLVTAVGGDELAGAVVMHIDITERKLAESAVKESEERFRNMFTAAATGIAISTPQGHYLQANAAYCQMLGYTEQELQALTFAEVTHPDDLAMNLKIRDELLAGQRESFVMEKRYLKKGGDIVWTRHSVSASHASDGAVIALIVVAEDITEAKKAEEAIKESEERFRGVFEQAAVGMALVSTDGRFLRVNTRLCTITGYDEAELLHMGFEDMTNAEEYAFCEEARAAILSGEKSAFRGERRYRRKNGEIVWVNVVLALERTPTGEPKYFIAVIQDISRRKLAEEELLSKTALLEAQLNSTLDGIIVIDSEGRKILHNQRIIDLWGMSDDIVETPDNEKRLAWMARQIKEPQPFLERIKWLYAHPTENSLDELELLDGRFMERYSAPVLGKNGSYYGRIWVTRDITQRKVAEKAFSEHMELISMASWVGKLGSWVAEYPGPRLIWSQEIHRIYEVEPGFKTDEESALSFFLPDSRQKLKAAIETKQPFDLELEIVTAKGNKRWVRTTSAVEMKEGVLHRYYGILQDVTERKRTETRFRRLVDSNAQSVFFWNTRGEITGANDAFLNIVGYSREDLAKGLIHWTSLTPPEYVEIDRRALEEIADRGFCSAYEKEYIRKNGSRVPILIGAATFEDNPDEGLAFVVDLTERKRVESRFRKMVDSNAQGVMFWKSSGEIKDGNDAFLNLVGYTREDLQAGRINWRTLTPPEYAEADRLALQEIAATGVCKSLEKEWIRKDGSRVPVYLSAAGFEDTPGEGVTFALDLSERKKLEQQFLRAQRMESIGTLAGGIAHDLNNILAPIMMSIDILKMTVMDAQSREILKTIEVSSKRGADIVRQVLSFARGMEGERIEVQPKHLVKDMEAIIRDTFPKNIRQELSLADETWTILGDPTQLHQILLNLCVNARDAMPNGGKLIIGVENAVLDQQYVTMNTEVKAGRYVMISVTDTGMGIPPGVLDKIFDPFFTTKEVGKGTGLGLSTVISIVKSHEGVINVYSEVGKGTTFKVYLPATATASPEQKKQTQSISFPRGNGETILVVDDEASILTITTQTLEAFGYRVLTATDGAEAVAVYAKDRDKIAVVLTDMMMPVMDGTSTIRALQRINPAVKIIAASGLNTNGSSITGGEASVKHFLMKPYTAVTLLKALRAILEPTS